MIKTKRPGVDVTVVLFYKPGNVPAKIDVKEISLPLPRPIRGYVPACPAISEWTA